MFSNLTSRSAGDVVLACAALLIVVLLSAAPIRAATLHYDAYLSGIPVGTAIVEITVSADSYRISGTAFSHGVAHLFSDWRSDFVAAGYLQHGAPTLTAYAYDERDKQKQRVLWLSDGTVRQVKNGQVRRSHPARAGTDIVTAFLLQGGCWKDRRLHTGRHSYRLSGRPASDAGGCHFEVTDDDGERSRFHVRFGEHEGLRVPIEARTKGLLRGRIKLRTAPRHDSDDGEAAGVLLAERP